mgnify:CR=1 FL=1
MDKNIRGDVLRLDDGKSAPWFGVELVDHLFHLQNFFDRNVQTPANFFIVMFFQNIEVLVWDFDGTLFRSDDALLRAVREAEYRVIMAHTHWNREKTIAEFSKKYKINIKTSRTVT